ncbi:MAG: hypothetical protein V4525_04235 [Pseudomonadota bacterium]
MDIHTSESDITQHSSATDLGTFFYPTHCLWVAFPNEQDAKTTHETLLAKGYNEKNCCVFESDKVIARAKRDLEENAGFLERLGWSYDAVEIHLEAAQQGATFLLIYEPKDSEIQNVMATVRQSPFLFVHYYTPLTIEILS